MQLGITLNLAYQGQHPCAVCKVLYGATCCEWKHLGGPQFPMTYSEAIRIANFIRKPLNEAVVIRSVPKSEERKLQEFDVYDVVGIIVGGHALYLPLTDSGTCVYLQLGRGCTIPNIKPHICTMFPFTWNRDYREWELGRAVQVPGFCFAQDNTVDDADAVKEFNFPPGLLSKTYRQWQQDKRVHARNMKRLWSISHEGRLPFGRS